MQKMAIAHCVQRCRCGKLWSLQSGTIVISESNARHVDTNMESVHFANDDCAYLEKLQLLTPAPPGASTTKCAMAIRIHVQENHVWLCTLQGTTASLAQG